MKEDTIIFETAKDSFYKMIVWGWLVLGPAFFLVSSVLFITGNNIADLFYFSIFGNLFMFACSHLMWNYFRYIITDVRFYVVIGPFKIREIKASSILRIQNKSKSSYVYGLSGKTISLIEFDGTETAISPVQNRELIDCLLSINPRIEIDEKLN